MFTDFPALLDIFMALPGMFNAFMENTHLPQQFIALEHIAQKNFCIAGKAFTIKVLRRMNGHSTFYNLFGSGISCLRIKRLRDFEIEFLICEILSNLCE